MATTEAGEEEGSEQNLKKQAQKLVQVDALEIICMYLILCNMRRFCA